MERFAPVAQNYYRVSCDCSSLAVWWHQVTQIVPELDDLFGVLSYIQNHLKTAEELELWRIWQGVESEPVIRTQTVPVRELTAEHIQQLQSRDVFATTTQYEIPVQY